MKKTFINQTENSNKFWTIEQNDKSYKVTWGKVGTEGRTNSKSFATTDECKKEVEKLIKEKTNKGYQEFSGTSKIPDKPIPNYKPWTKMFFGKSFLLLIGVKPVTMMPYYDLH